MQDVGLDDQEILMCLKRWMFLQLLVAISKRGGNVNKMHDVDLKC